MIVLDYSPKLVLVILVTILSITTTHSCYSYDNNIIIRDSFAHDNSIIQFNNPRPRGRGRAGAFQSKSVKCS